MNPDRMRKKYERAVYFSKLRIDDTDIPVKVACISCGREFMTIYDKKFCGPKCRKDHKLKIARCIECGELLSTKGINKERGYCCDECRQAAQLKRAKEKGNYIPCKCCGKMFIRKSVSNVNCSKECTEADRQAKPSKPVSPKPVKEKKTVPTGKSYVKCACCGFVFDAALMKNGEKYCCDNCRDTKMAEELAKESAKAKKKAKSNPKQAEHICVRCKTSQKECERFTSNFVYTPIGAKHETIDGKRIIVFCPKFS